MKILQIAPAWIDTPPKGYGGTEWVISNLVKGLEDLGHDVTLFATKKSKSAGKLDYVFEKAFLDMKIPWECALPALIHYHQAFSQAKNYDIVHAHLSSETDMIILPFLSDLTKQGIPNLMTIHGHAPFDRHSNMDKTFFKLYQNDIWAVNISQTMQKAMPAKFKDAGFVYNSLDTSTMKFNSKKGDYLTWLGKILPVKGTADAIKAAKMAGEKIVFAGIVDEYQEISVKYFKEQVEPLIDGKQVIYLGPADMKLKNQLLGGAKAFLNPIDWEEPFGMVMVEAMACGTPIISYARGAAKELVVDGKTGFLVKNMPAMLAAIKKIDTINRADCRAHIDQNFSIEAAARYYLSVYGNIIKSTLSQSLKSQRLIFPVPKLPVSAHS